MFHHNPNLLILIEMDTSKVKRRFMHNRYTDVSNVKSVAKTLLQLKEDQFELENIKSHRINKAIDYIICKEAAKEDSDKGIAFIIKL